MNIELWVIELYFQLENLDKLSLDFRTIYLEMKKQSTAFVDII